MLIIFWPGLSLSSASSSNYFPPDIVLIVQGRPIEAHKVILSVRSPFFRKKFETDWKGRREVRFGREKLSYAALYSLIHFFYSDRLEIAVDDMEDLVRICKVCKCESLRRVLEKELVHQKYAEYKALRDVDNSQKRFIFQGLSLPEEDRLPSSLRRILQASMANLNANNLDSEKDGVVEELICRAERMNVSDLEDDLADVCIRVDGKIFRCHQVVLASRSDYFKARLSRMMDFHEGKDGSPVDSLPCIDERDLSTEAFEKIAEFM